MSSQTSQQQQYHVRYESQAEAIAEASSRTARENGKGKTGGISSAGNCLGVRGYLTEIRGKPALGTKFSYIDNSYGDTSKESVIIDELLDALPSGSIFPRRLADKCSEDFVRTVDSTTRSIMNRIENPEQKSAVTDMEKMQIEDEWTLFSAKWYGSIFKELDRQYGYKSELQVSPLSDEMFNKSLLPRETVVLWSHEKPIEIDEKRIQDIAKCYEADRTMDAASPTLTTTVNHSSGKSAFLVNVSHILELDKARNKAVNRSDLTGLTKEDEEMVMTSGKIPTFYRYSLGVRTEFCKNSQRDPSESLSSIEKRLSQFATSGIPEHLLTLRGQSNSAVRGSRIIFNPVEGNEEYEKLCARGGKEIVETIQSLLSEDGFSNEEMESALIRNVSGRKIRNVGHRGTITLKE